MKNLNLIGIQVQSMEEAIVLLGCTRETLDYQNSVSLINGFTFNIHTYTTTGNSNFYFAVTAVNLESKEHEVKDTQNERFARKCDITGEGMDNGFYVNEDVYIKNDEVILLDYILKNTNYKTLSEAYNDGYYYYTEWHEEEDCQYEMINGVLTEIQQP